MASSLAADPAERNDDVGAERDASSTAAPPNEPPGRLPPR
jgi:hypothetical protein